MTLSEYEKIKQMTYYEYCSYLRRKYGVVPYNYFTDSGNKNGKNSRTSEGLFIHHIYESKFAKISDKQWCNTYNYPKYVNESQSLVYCDYLEHLLLHVMICEEFPNRPYAHPASGLIYYLLPHLYDIYIGKKSTTKWMQTCDNLVVNDKDAFKYIFSRLVKSHIVPIQLLLSGSLHADKTKLLQLFTELVDFSRKDDT